MRIEMLRQLNSRELFLYGSLILFFIFMIIAFPVYVTLSEISTGNQLKEILKGLQFTAKITALMGGVLAFFNRNSFVKYIIILFLSSFMIDFGVETFIYYAIESTIAESAKLTIKVISIVIQIIGLSGLIAAIAGAITDFVLYIYKKI